MVRQFGLEAEWWGAVFRFPVLHSKVSLGTSIYNAWIFFRSDKKSLIMSNFIIHITFDEKESVKLNFTPQEFNWENLVDAIIRSNYTTCIDLPIVLYYRNGLTISSLENQEQLLKLPIRTTLELYSQRELVKEPAFNRLGQLIETHKQVISCSRRISRCVGILASAIALDTNNKDFNNEFKALEKVIESRKDGEKTQMDAPQNIHDNSSRPHHSGRGFGHGFGGSRGHHHGYPADFLEKNHHKSCFRGGVSSEDSSAEEIDVLRTQLLNTHIDKHGKGFKKRHGSPYSFGYHF